ncbi:MAG TPA: hypothetical protein VNL14_07515 [Candidatus Acidoferrales bacterium]|nr:hypothetical protein [Candidatus Acidoferrales bacterium]
MAARRARADEILITPALAVSLARDCKSSVAQPWDRSSRFYARRTLRGLFWNAKRAQALGAPALRRFAPAGVIGNSV